MKYLIVMASHFAIKSIGMRAITIAFFLLLLAACDPPGDLYDTGIVNLTAHVLNPQPIIHLGDSVAFYFEVPDSIILNGTRIAVSASTRDGGSVGFFTNKIIATRAAGFETNIQSCIRYAKLGYLTNSGLEFTNYNGRLLGKFYMIPRQKGIYFFEQAENGYLDLNNRNLLLRFSFSFGTINRSHQLLIDSAGPASRFSSFLQGRTSQGYEVYGFRVI